jgi:GNAT superfamily N-acetyltransferase
MMTPEIRAATADDLPQVRKLEEQWACDDETIGFQATPSDLLKQFVGGCFFVAVLDTEIIGFVYCSVKRNTGSMSAVFPNGERYLEIEDLYVAPPNRSGGLGHQLINVVSEWAKKERIRYLSAYSSTRDVDRILRFYRSCGFTSWFVQMIRDLNETDRS